MRNGTRNRGTSIGLSVAALMLVAVGCGNGQPRVLVARTPTPGTPIPSVTSTPPASGTPSANPRRRTAQANDDVIGNALSADGRFVLMTSEATNLVRGPTYFCDYSGHHRPCANVYVRDRKTGRTEIVSLSATARRGHGASGGNAISRDGRYVLFSSDAQDLLPGPPKRCADVEGDEGACMDVFVRDRTTGNTERVSVSSNGQRANGMSSGLAISDDGRYVLFTSWASNLAQNDHNSCEAGLDVTLPSCEDAFVRDRRTGTTTLVSVTSDGRQSSSPIVYASMSGDGRYVAYCCASDDTSSHFGVVVRDMTTGTTTFIGGGDGVRACCSDVRISDDGNTVAYHDDFTPFVADRASPSPKTIPPGNHQTWSQGLASDGKRIAIVSFSTDLGAHDANGDGGDCFVYDLFARRYVLVSGNENGRTLPQNSDYCLISPDGATAAFTTIAAAVPGDTNRHLDVYVRSLSSGAIERVSMPG